jgi:hypothetical protein
MVRGSWFRSDWRGMRTGGGVVSGWAVSRQGFEAAGGRGQGMSVEGEREMCVCAVTVFDERGGDPG